MTVMLGDTVRCKYTGFEGVATHRLEQIGGPIRIGVQPVVETDMKLGDLEYFNESVLEVIAFDQTLVPAEKQEKEIK